MRATPTRDPAGGDLDAVFQALSDPTRRGILRILEEGERATGKIAEEFPVSRPAVSKHLRVLYDAELVTRRKEGRNRLYALRPEPLAEAYAWLDRYRRLWRGSLEGLKRHLEAEAGRRERGGAGP